MIALRKGLLFLILLLVAVSAQAATWTTIDVPGATNTRVYGINTYGDLVGNFDDAGGTHGFLLSAGTFTTLDPPGATFTLAWGINIQGFISGYFFDSNSVAHGFLSDGQTFTTIDYPGAASTFGNGINNLGQIVGAFTDAQNTNHGFLLSNGNFSIIDFPASDSNQASGITHDGFIAGTYGKSNGSQLEYHSYVRDRNGKFRRIGKKGVAGGISDRKIIVGYGGIETGNDYGYRFNLNTNVQTKMRYPGAVRTRCYGVNKSGHIVGNYLDASGVRHGFIWMK